MTTDVNGLNGQNRVGKRPFKMDGHTTMRIDRDTIIREIQRVGRDKQRTPTRQEFYTETGISRNRIYQLFDNWREAILAAGLQPHYQGATIEDETLFEEMRRVFLEHGVCTEQKFGKWCKYNVATYDDHFGRWPEVLLAFRHWIELNKIEFPFIDELPRALTEPHTETNQNKAKTLSKKRKLSRYVLGGDYLDLSRISQLRAIASENFDLIKLIRLCEELNTCYTDECFLAVAMIVRAILDHVPPVFGCKDFAEVSNNYGGSRSFKESMQHLQNSSRKIADAYLHEQIRKREILPNKTQVNFRNELDFLLAEIVRILK